MMLYASYANLSILGEPVACRPSERTSRICPTFSDGRGLTAAFLSAANVPSVRVTSHLSIREKSRTVLRAASSRRASSSSSIDSWPLVALSSVEMRLLCFPWALRTLLSSSSTARRRCRRPAGGIGLLNSLKEAVGRPLL